MSPNFEHREHHDNERKQSKKSGEDYLYPSSYFIDARLSKSVEAAVVNAA